MGASAEIDKIGHSLTKGVVDMKGFFNLFFTAFGSAAPAIWLPPDDPQSVPAGMYIQPPPRFGRGVAKQRRAAMKARRAAAHRRACR